MSGPFEIGYSLENHEVMVRCGKGGCGSATSMKELLASCPSDLRKELYDYLGLLIVREQSTRIAYRDNRVELVAACSNISTSELMKVVEHRAHVMEDRAAQKVMRDLGNADDTNSTDESEDSVFTGLVWVDDGREDQPRLFCEGEMWRKIEELANSQDMKEIDEKIAVVDALMTDTEANPLGTGESLGDRNTRVFIAWASDLLCKGGSNDYPLKLYSDALAIDRFFYHMNESCGSLTDEQYDDFKESVITLFDKKAIDCGLSSRLNIRRYTHGWNGNVLSRIYESDD